MHIGPKPSELQACFKQMFQSKGEPSPSAGSIEAKCKAKIQEISSTWSFKVAAYFGLDSAKSLQDRVYSACMNARLEIQIESSKGYKNLSSITKGLIGKQAPGSMVDPVKLIGEVVNGLFQPSNLPGPGYAPAPAKGQAPVGEAFGEKKTSPEQILETQLARVNKDLADVKQTPEGRKACKLAIAVTIADYLKASGKGSPIEESKKLLETYYGESSGVNLSKAEKEVIQRVVPEVLFHGGGEKKSSLEEKGRHWDFLAKTALVNNSQLLRLKSQAVGEKHKFPSAVDQAFQLVWLQDRVERITQALKDEGVNQQDIEKLREKLTNNPSQDPRLKYSTIREEALKLLSKTDEYKRIRLQSSMAEVAKTLTTIGVPESEVTEFKRMMEKISDTNFEAKYSKIQQKALALFDKYSQQSEFLKEIQDLMSGEGSAIDEYRGIMNKQLPGFTDWQAQPVGHDLLSDELYNLLPEEAAGDNSTIGTELGWDRVYELMAEELG